MGCWNETCFMSHLPIMRKEDVVVFVLTPTVHINEEGPSCYYDDKYVPLSFPLRGKYNEYGGLYDIQHEEMHATFLPKIKQYFTREDGEYTPYNWVSVEKFLTDISSRKVFVAVPGDTYRRLALAFVHAKLYDILLGEISNRIPYGKNETVRQLYQIRVRDSFMKYKELVLNTPFSSGAFCEMMYLNPTKYRHIEIIVRDMFTNADEKLMTALEDYRIWGKVMNYSRVGYCTNSGCAGQDAEFTLHKLIAKFIFEHCDTYIAQQLEDDPETNPLTVLDETFYWM